MNEIEFDEVFDETKVKDVLDIKIKIIKPILKWVP